MEMIAHDAEGEDFGMMEGGRGAQHAQEHLLLLGAENPAAVDGPGHDVENSGF
jgi:hypothetical protein